MTRPLSAYNKAVKRGAPVDTDIQATAGSIGTTEIADDAVTSAKIADGAVGNDQIADSAVTGAKLDATLDLSVNLVNMGNPTTSMLVGIADNGSAIEYLSGVRKVVINLEDLNLGTIIGAGGAAVGAEFYTFPDGDIIVHGASMKDVALTETDGNVTADTPDLGIGTTKAEGADSALSDTPATENIMTGQTAANVNGGNNNAVVAANVTIPSTTASANRKLYLNAADTWAGEESVGIIANGTISVLYSVVSS